MANKKGRPKININWAEVEKYLMAGCSGTQIAAALGIHKDTLYERCKTEHGMIYSNYSAEKRQKGNSALLGKQFQVAMSGNVSMLVWLGKQRLGQQETPKLTDGFNGKLAEFLDEIKKMNKAKEDA